MLQVGTVKVYIITLRNKTNIVERFFIHGHYITRPQNNVVALHFKNIIKHSDI